MAQHPTGPVTRTEGPRMTSRTRRLVPLSLAAAALAGVALARDADTPAKDTDKPKVPQPLINAPANPGLSGVPGAKADAKPATVKAEQAPFKVEATLKGVFEAPQM